jgi:DNA repair photolyase
MSSVLSTPAPSLQVRRRPVRKTAVTLFSGSAEPLTSATPVGQSPSCVPVKQATIPNSPHAPNPKSGGNAGLGGSGADRPTPDCPPALRVTTGPQSHGGHRIRSAAAPLVGIARLAADSAPAETCRASRERPEYFLLPVRSILNRCDSKRVPFEWTINPYRGCEFGCKYCYARYTHEYMEIDGGEFEKKIFVKQDAGALLGAEISRKYSYHSKASGFTQAEHIAIGTATDPYQPAEREYGVTRACLEELAKRERLSVSLITKSNQIVRDIELLQRIAERSDLAIDITITTLRPRLARLLEPRAPRPDLRLAAVKQLCEAGLAVGVSASPMVPGITDGEGELEAVAEAAKQAGAQWFFSGVLFLMPASAKTFLPFVRERFPRLATRYEQWYRKNGYAPEQYRRKASQRVARIREKYGFKTRPWVVKTHTTPCAQLNLGWGGAEAPKREQSEACRAG